jgi:hypothetical protein
VLKNQAFARAVSEEVLEGYGFDADRYPVRRSDYFRGKRRRCQCFTENKLATHLCSEELPVIQAQIAEV